MQRLGRDIVAYIPRMIGSMQDSHIGSAVALGLAVESIVGSGSMVLSPKTLMTLLQNLEALNLSPKATNSLHHASTVP